jgi:hypothetical protein
MKALKSMEMVYKFLIMEISILENINKECLKDMDNIIGIAELFIEEIFFLE